MQKEEAVGFVNAFWFCECFCECFNEMHSNDDYEKDVWNKYVDKHKGIIIGIDFAKDKDGEC